MIEIPAGLITASSREPAKGLRSSSNDWNMICIKANDIPRQSIKLVRTAGEERKRYHQNVIVSDASSLG